MYAHVYRKDVWKEVAQVNSLLRGSGILGGFNFLYALISCLHFTEIIYYFHNQKKRLKARSIFERKKRLALVDGIWAFVLSTRVSKPRKVPRNWVLRKTSGSQLAQGLVALVMLQVFIPRLLQPNLIISSTETLCSPLNTQNASSDQSFQFILLSSLQGRGGQGI